MSTLPDQRLDGAALVCGAGGKMGIDATRKMPTEGTVFQCHNEIDMMTEARERVTWKWDGYGLQP